MDYNSFKKKIPFDCVVTDINEKLLFHKES